MNWRTRRLMCFNKAPTVNSHSSNFQELSLPLDIFDWCNANVKDIPLHHVLFILRATFLHRKNLQHELFCLLVISLAHSLLSLYAVSYMWNWVNPTRDALIGSWVGLVHQVGLIMQIPASSSLPWVKTAILMIKELMEWRQNGNKRGGLCGRRKD